MLREPWNDAIIVKLFHKGVGYIQLKKRLRALKGDFSLIDIGFDYYVIRFMNREDYEHVLIDGPWMIGDNYQVIREWVTNFVPEEDKITKLTAWMRIPKLGIEYLNKNFLYNEIDSKISEVSKPDSTPQMWKGDSSLTYA